MRKINENEIQKVKLGDVADKAGVSRTTVSRVLNNRGYISDKTRQKVHEAVELLNYQPNEIARSLFIKKTYIIGLIFPTTNNPFYGQLIFHLENICESLGYRVLLCNSQGREDKEKDYLKMLQRHQVDGIIAGAHNRGIEEYNNQHLPLVGIDRYLSKNIPVVSSDNYDGGKKATRLLIDKGCKQIIHINGSPSLETPANLRREAYEDVMKENQFHPRTYIIGDNIIERLFDENPNVDGIFASDDLIAANVIREAKRRNINIPGDLKVIGYDGTETTRILLPELSTIQQPVKEIADLAIKLLMKQINGESESQIEWKLPIKLIKGETT
ncbi:LacI family DNA-binding transcriptional regulator [Oceanobacillus polygoni]|uniref:LacI family sucrose operon transcriptional repressor n=1 Tax=Oceanobacillus polygoni TaxID=1235259 RepID=A0A9X0YQJ5_9BACI|nr:LacI family DNA-binding transcriptional regulator [Oceanobacillus polygoni]MBP2075967.1 LacI family sucrose operon transcriptional repressor [Oceanobacillus polygoni]